MSAGEKPVKGIGEAESVADWGIMTKGFGAKGGSTGISTFYPISQNSKC